MNIKLALNELFEKHAQNVLGQLVVSEHEWESLFNDIIKLIDISNELDAIEHSIKPEDSNGLDI